jgi:MATE family multidrug resistance protein
MNAMTHLPGRASQTVTLWSQDVRATVTLAVPLVLIELAWVAMVTTDTVMMGWLGPESLAAGALAGQFFLFFEYFAIGVLAAVAPILS